MIKMDMINLFLPKAHTNYRLLPVERSSNLQKRPAVTARETK
jgi:hypothetical protein